MADALLDRLRAVLRDGPALRWAILFGSVARGTSRPDSDVDIAIDPASKLSDAEETALGVALERAAGRPVDLVLIERAPPALRWRIARDGVVLCSCPAHAASRFLARTGIEHDANAELEQRASELYRARLAQGLSPRDP